MILSLYNDKIELHSEKLKNIHNNLFDAMNKDESPIYEPK